MADLAAEMARFEAELAGVGDGGPHAGGPGPQPGQLPPPPPQFAFNGPPPGSAPYGGVRAPLGGHTWEPQILRLVHPGLLLSAPSLFVEPLLLPAVPLAAAVATRREGQTLHEKARSL